MQSKCEMFIHFWKFKILMEKEIEQIIECLQSYGRGEYFTTEFSNFLENEEIWSKVSH